MKEMEKILTNNPNRYVIYPIEHPDIWEFYKTAQAAFWTAETVDLSKDLEDWDKLNDNERFFIKNVISFFSSSDGLVNNNIAHNFINEVQYPEASFFYGFQIAMENIHNLMYSLLIDTYIKDVDERDECFRAMEKLPIVKKKAEWALNWIESESFAERLIAFAAVEGIFFSGSFCSIFWLKSRGLMPGLCQANSYISKDEALHTDFAVHLYNNHVEYKLTEERIKEIILSAYEIEKEFITDSLPVSLIGMNQNLMTQYIQFVTDQLLIQFRCKPVFNAKQPFDFMMQIAMKAKQNFFEGRPTEYKKADLSGSISFDEEF
jgi:ribonucleoside-diphosphate reductase beta chain